MLLGMLGGCGGASAPGADNPSPVSAAPALPVTDPTPGPPVPVSAPSEVFAWPRQIAADISPYASVDEALADEDRIDWRREHDKARAITLAFAAQELQSHLEQIGLQLPIVPTRPQLASSSFVLALANATTAPLTPGPAVPWDRLGIEGYALSPAAGNVHITAGSRIGVLNGTYRLLELLGFSWYDPQETLTPASTSPQAHVSWPVIRERPRIRLRGYWIYGAQTIPDAFAIWMRRNRLNIGGIARPPVRHKLGLVGWGGGHDVLQQELADAELFRRHPNWFAEINGIRRPVGNGADYDNPAFSNTEMAVHVAGRLIARLETGDLQHIDVLNIWPADNRFNTFDQSAEARAFGNETDTLLHFYATVMAQFQQARRDGRLSRDVTLAGISYFLTMQAPTRRDVVEKLKTPGYLHLFYPIDRSWSGPVDSQLADRDANRRLVENLSAWGSIGAGLDFGVVDYHNLSSFAALAVTDLPYLAKNFEHFTRGREGLFAYMHPLNSNPGPRRLTNHLLARLSWESLGTTGARTASDLERELTAAYFQKRYGPHADAWHAIHRTMATSVENASELFGIDSLYWLLLQGQLWADPFYGPDDTVDFIRRFRSGGSQALPTRFSNHGRLRATFLGLDASIALQEGARTSWMRIVRSVDPPLRDRLQSDIEWFEATASRYRLMAATADFVLAQISGQSVLSARDRMVQEIILLEATPVTRDTISPVDQRGFLEAHRRLAGLP